MVKKGFPSFGITQCGSYVAALKNYNLPDFVLTLVAKDCNSELLARGRIDDRLSSMYHKSEIVINESIPGKSGKNHKIPIAVKQNSMYTAIGFNKPIGNAVSKRDIKKFYEIVSDVKSGEHGTQLIDAVFGSSSGFKVDALIELEELSKNTETEGENKLNFKTANFENRIYSVTKC